MKFRIALTAAATVALAACGSNDDVSTEAEPETVEYTADEALEGVDEQPVADPAADIAAPRNVQERAEVAAEEAATIEEAGDNAAATAEAAMDEMYGETED